MAGKPFDHYFHLAQLNPFTGTVTACGKTEKHMVVYTTFEPHRVRCPECRETEVWRQAVLDGRDSS